MASLPSYPLWFETYFTQRNLFLTHKLFPHDRSKSYWVLECGHASSGAPYSNYLNISTPLRPCLTRLYHDPFRVRKELSLKLWLTFSLLCFQMLACNILTFYIYRTYIRTGVRWCTQILAAPTVRASFGIPLSHAFEKDGTRPYPTVSAYKMKS